MANPMQTSSGVERRFIAQPEDASDAAALRVERRTIVRARPDGKQAEEEVDVLVGYAARFNVMSLDLGDFTERIDPNAFSLVTQKKGRKPLDTRALLNHDPNFVLGRYPKTLSLSVDDIGLRYEVEPPDHHRGVAASVRRGDISGSSFAFMVPSGGDKWSLDERGRHVRTILRVSDLLDVGPVTYPAYPDASVACRSFKEFMDGTAKFSKRMADAAARADAIREWLKNNAR
jgi:HK97 family phage prohead protease